jgi:signal transduction histidine kinase
LERNLHDGAQQQLVALAVQARMAEDLAGKDPNRERELLRQVQQGVQEALEDLRDLARGIYPPLLVDQGLPAALEAQARKVPMPVSVDTDGIDRYPQELEATVYFCVLEALQNATKYAGASEVSVRVWRDDGDLVFAVTDDGRGFDRRTTSLGTGMRNMSDRLAAVGGSLAVRSQRGLGTSVLGRIPIPSVEPG